LRAFKTRIFPSECHEEGSNSSARRKNTLERNKRMHRKRTQSDASIRKFEESTSSTMSRSGRMEYGRWTSNVQRIGIHSKQQGNTSKDFGIVP
jgi:hypothetical protein